MSGPYSLTREEREEILRLYEAGVKVDSIAAQFGVGREYPSKLAHRRGLPRRKGKYHGRSGSTEVVRLHV